MVCNADYFIPKEEIMIDKDFVVAGRAVFTITIPESFREEQLAKRPDKPQPRVRYTYKITHKEKTKKFKESWLVCLLIGSDNTNDYKCFGKLDVATGDVTLTRSTDLSDKSWAVVVVQKALAAIWQDRAHEITEHGWDVMHAGRCCKCGRQLTVPESISSGWGPECQKKRS